MNYREFRTQSGKTILCGRNAEQNEKLVREFTGKENVLIHTIASGSPFCVITGQKTTAKDVRETAIICAGLSQDWRDNKGDVAVHFFTGKDIYKEKRMKTGTFGIRNAKKMTIKKKQNKGI